MGDVMTRRKRLVFWMEWFRNCWTLRCGKSRLYTNMAKREALQHFAIEAKLCAPSMLRIRAKDGRIIGERTYGADPRRRRG